MNRKQRRASARDDNYVSPRILRTYYATEHVPTAEEFSNLGIDLSRIFHVDNGPQVSQAIFDRKIDAVMDTIWKRKQNEPY